MTTAICKPQPEPRRGRTSPIVAAVLLGALAAVIASAPPAGATECPAKPYRQQLSPTRPLNLGELKRQLLDYHCFGAYDRDVARVAAEAQRYVERRAGQVKRPALVLDVDETALSNWPLLLTNDFGYIIEGSCDMRRNFACGYRAWENSGQAPAIKPVLALFRAAKRKGVAVFFITGRTDDTEQRGGTEKNLNQAGYEGFTALIMRPASENRLSIAEFKARERAKIEKLGYRIIANVGDQWSDLRGGHAERSFRIPNPFYFIP